VSPVKYELDFYIPEDGVLQYVERFTEQNEAGYERMLVIQLHRLVVR
jgi:hypothetical protein